MNKPDVSLFNKDSSVVRGLGHSHSPHTSLKPPLQEIFSLQLEDVIELGLGLVKDAKSVETTDEGSTLAAQRKTSC
jgi:hypothetical protein